MRQLITMVLFVAAPALLLFANPSLAQDCQVNKIGTLPVEMIGNRPTTTVSINGTDERFVVDTGAFFNTMSAASAQSMGLKLKSTPLGDRVVGVGGEVGTQQTRVENFGIFGTTYDNVNFVVAGSDVDGGRGVLGANLLEFADIEIDLAQGKITLLRTGTCGDSSPYLWPTVDKSKQGKHVSLAYWSTQGRHYEASTERPLPKGDRRTFLNVFVNGTLIHALIDTGATTTMLSRDAAERAGLDLNGPNARPAGTTHGFGAKTLNRWIVTVDKIEIGSETLQHSQVSVIDGSIGTHTDMLLGVDFLLAHHVLISNSMGKMYFTRNSGHAYTDSPVQSASSKVDAGTSPNGSDSSSRTANDYALSGEAHLSRGETMSAVADLGQAIVMAPDQAAYYVARARAYRATRQLDAELADLDKAISLDPKNLDALMMRVELRAARKDSTGALADANAASTLVPAGSEQARTLAHLYDTLNQPALALPLLDDWMRLHPDDVMLGAALSQRCWARAMSKQMLEDGLKDCKKAIKRDGAKPNYLLNLGLVEYQLGDNAESIKAYQQTLALQTRNMVARYYLGLAEVRAGQTAAGKADMDAALALDPRVAQVAAEHGLIPPTP